MRYGFVTAQGNVDQMVEMAREAEACGWDGVFTYDGISIGPGETHDPWVLLGAMSMVTERVRLGAMIFALPRRRPWKVAREAITVDHLSKGRLVMPVGLGTIDDAGISRVNTDTPDRRIRARRLDETLEILQLAWRGERFGYDGDEYQLHDMVFEPRPVQQPRIPIWVVGAWPRPRSMNRAIRWDGIVPMNADDPFSPITGETVRDIATWVRDHRDADGPFDIVIEGATDGTDLAGTHDRIAPLAEAGATWWIESRWGEAETVDSLTERIRQGPPRTEEREIA